MDTEKCARKLDKVHATFDFAQVCSDTTMKRVDTKLRQTPLQLSEHHMQRPLLQEDCLHVFRVRVFPWPQPTHVATNQIDSFVQFLCDCGRFVAHRACRLCIRARTRPPHPLHQLGAHDPPCHAERALVSITMHRFLISDECYN